MSSVAHLATMRSDAFRAPGYGKSCAIVEAYNRHDEVYLTTAYLLRRLGYDVHVFNTWRNRIKDSFVHAPGVKPRITSSLNSLKVLTAAEQGSYDLVVFNTIEGAEVVGCAKRISARTPILGFVHNASFVTAKPEYRELASNPRCHLMVLAPYIASRFAGVAAAGFMYPVFFSEHALTSIAPSVGKRRLCVQGYFDPGRRHYEQLVQAVHALARKGREDFEVWVMGRSYAAAFRGFQKRIEQLGLAKFFRYTWKGVGYGTYYRLLNSVDFILPLISPASHPAYFSSKSTSSIAAAVGFGKIPLVHRRLAELYGIAAQCLTYEDDMVRAVEQAMTLSDQDLERMQQRIVATRRAFLEQSEAQLVCAIDKVARHVP